MPYATKCLECADRQAGERNAPGRSLLHLHAQPRGRSLSAGRRLLESADLVAMRGRILIADMPAAHATLRTVLAPEAAGPLELLYASTMSAARDILCRGVDLVVCGIHFDDSRMFDLLHYVRAEPQFSLLPCICFRDLDSLLELPLLEGLRIACRVLGAEFVVSTRSNNDSASHGPMRRRFVRPR